MTRFLDAVDTRLMAAPRSVRVATILLTVVALAAAALPRIPRTAVDYSRWPLLRWVQQPVGFGTDTIADMYEARVVRRDIGDMYTKQNTPQTPLEAATWSRRASSPYPPVMLLALAGLSVAGDAVGIGFYGMAAGLAVGFLALSLAYCLRTRWYLFPLLYLNASYLGERFFYVQDTSYLAVLITVMFALLTARKLPILADVLMAVATTMKLSPLFYGTTLLRTPRAAVIFAAIVTAGLVLPYFVWDNYLDIFRYHGDQKPGWTSTAGALLLAGAFAAVLTIADRRRVFDLEDLIGWSLVPVGVFLAFRMNAARHLILLLFIPDKRVIRNIAVVVGLFIEAVVPAVGLNTVLPLMTLILGVGLKTFVAGR